MITNMVEVRYQTLTIAMQRKLGLAWSQSLGEVCDSQLLVTKHKEYNNNKLRIKPSHPSSKLKLKLKMSLAQYKGVQMCLAGFGSAINTRDSLCATLCVNKKGADGWGHS